MQTAIVILIVAACACWLIVQAYQFLRPKANGKQCAGGCCDGGNAPATRPAAEAAAAPRQVMISSDDIRSRLKARQR